VGGDTGRGHGYLTGMIWRDDAGLETVAGHTVNLIGPAEALQTTVVGDLGEFAFDAIPPGTYSLEIHLTDQHVVIEEVSING
jgi:hypothetical protein